MNRLVIVALLLAIASAPALGATLDRLRESGVLRIGYREDAPPYAYRNEVGEAAGYTVELCRAVAAHLKQALGLDEIRLEYVPVDAKSRFEAVRDGRVDVHCGAATATLSRREIVDFSLPIFVDGASVLYRADGPRDFEGVAGQRVGVHGDTTTEQALRDTLEDLGMQVEVVTVADHDEGLRRLEEGDLSAYFADRAILTYLAMRSDAKDQLRLSERYFTIEPYALVLPRGDDDFRLEVDRALSRIYRSGEIEGIFTSSFGQEARPSEILKALYVISALPE
jgi:ABC-type amino acid transport substrate-binding protein